MKDSSSIIKTALAFVLIVAVGVGIGWLASRRKSARPPEPEAINTTLVEQTQVTNNPKKRFFDRVSEAERQAAAAAAPVETGVTNTVDWEDKVSDILAADNEITNKVQDLLVLYPKAPATGKLEIAEHLTNLVGNDKDEYKALADILTNPTNLPPAVAEHLLTDLFNRPRSLMLPLTLRVARDPNNPGQKIAQDNWVTMVGKDEWPEDPDVQDEATKEFLEQNPD